MENRLITKRATSASGNLLPRLIGRATLLLIIATGTAMAYEEPEFELLETVDDYEIRRYAAYIVAEVDVQGETMADAGNDAFRLLAGYIFGANEPGAKMKMTAPVESRSTRDGQRMKMTAPVESRRATDGESAYTYAFVMERQYTLDSLPKPLEPSIRLVERSPRVMAVRRYSGGWSDKNYRKNEALLIEALQGASITTIGAPELARYNSPFTPWFMRRNEVMIAIDWPQQVP